MRIALVGPPPENGGVGKYTEKLANRLGSEVERLELPRPMNITPIKVAKLAYRLREYDIVHIQFTYGLFGYRGSLSWFLYPLLIGVPTITTMHEVWDKETVSTPPYRVKYAYLIALHSLIKQCNNRVVLLSENAREDLSETVTINHEAVIPHGLETTPEIRFDPDQAKEEFGYTADDIIVSQIGYTSERKGTETFLAAAKDHPDINFLYAGGPRNEGDGSYFEMIKREAPENVQITGTLSDDLFHAAFDASDLVLLPYHSINQSGILNWCVSHEVPALASDIQYFKLLNDEFGYPLIQPHRKISENIVHALEGSPDFTELKEKHSMEKVVKRHFELYRLE